MNVNPTSITNAACTTSAGRKPAPSLKPFEEGDLLLVSGPPGEVLGTVLHASTVEEMPDLGQGSDSKHALDIMREMQVDLMLLIEHLLNNKPVCFWAVHNPNGWVDLRGQKLTIQKTYPMARA